MASGILWVQLLEGTAGTSVEDGRNVQVECDVVENLHAAQLLPASIRYMMIWKCLTPFKNTRAKEKTLK